MLTLNQIKEELSLVYVHAIASQCGYSFEITRKDMDSIDGSIRASGYVTADAIYTSPSIDLQLKATSSPVISGNVLKFKLPIKNYDDLRGNSILPRYLIVLILPTARETWLEVSPERLSAQKCAYYLDLRGKEPVENDTNITIDIPLENLFTINTLKNLIHKVAMGEHIGNL